jgi:hypothetical protein
VDYTVLGTVSVLRAAMIVRLPKSLKNNENALFDVNVSNSIQFRLFP